jgi:hypothetical protein
MATSTSCWRSALGMTHATELAKQINAGAFDGNKLAVAGWNSADRQAAQGPQRL